MAAKAPPPNTPGTYTVTIGEEAKSIAYLPLRAGVGESYQFDWTEKMIGQGNIRITSSSWTIAPSGPTLTDNDFDDDHTKVTIEATTEHAGKQFLVTNWIVDSDSEAQARSMTLRGMWP